MALKISGKNVDIGQVLRNRIEDEVSGAVDKFFGGGYSGHVTISRDGREFGAECSVHLDTGIVFEAHGRDADANIAFDKAAERLEKRLRRYHRRLKDHKKASSRDRAQVAAYILEAPAEDTEIAEDFSPTIVAETQTPVNTMSVSHAVMELDRTEVPVVVFRNMSHGEINVVFRRADGNFGWIDPTLNKDRSGG